MAEKYTTLQVKEIYTYFEVKHLVTFSNWNTSLKTTNLEKAREEAKNKKNHYGHFGPVFISKITICEKKDGTVYNKKEDFEVFK